MTGDRDRDEDATDHLARAVETGRQRARSWATVTVEIAGDPVTGLWCPHCALPSRITIVVLLNGIPVTHSWCQR